MGESLRLRREPTNSVDKHAVAVIKDGDVVGHVPYNLAPRFSQLLMRNANKAFTEMMGKEVNSGAGYGQEVQCVFRLYGPKRYIEKIKEFVDALIAAGLL